MPQILHRGLVHNVSRP